MTSQHPDPHRSSPARGGVPGISLTGVTKDYGKNPVLVDVTADLAPGRVYGLLTIAVRGDANAVDAALAQVGTGVTVEEQR